MLGFGSIRRAKAALPGPRQVEITKEKELFNGDEWRTPALDELIPLWYKHARDLEQGAFYLNLARDWKPCPPREKPPPIRSRDVFGFSATYLLSGDEKYLDVA